MPIFVGDLVTRLWRDGTDIDTRLLRRRRGSIRAGIGDLKTELDATGELAIYRHERRTDAREDPRAGRHRDALELISAAVDAYERLITEHVDYAGSVIDRNMGRGRRTGVAWPAR